MIARTLLRAFVANACLAAPSVACAQALPPPADMKLAHDIYKQFSEIHSGYSTGATTPVAEAAAARLKEAGFPESDIFLAVRRRRSSTWSCVITAPGCRGRCCFWPTPTWSRLKTRGLYHRPVRPQREGWLFLRPRHRRR